MLLEAVTASKDASYIFGTVSYYTIWMPLVQSPKMKSHGTTFVTVILVRE